MALLARASRAFDEGLQSVGRPFSQPGSPIPAAEPFSPGSTSVGALTAKLIRNIMAGSRMRGNETRQDEIYRRGLERQGLEMDVLRQTIAGGELVDFTDDTGTYKIPRRQLGPLLDNRSRRSGIDPDWAMDPTKEGSPAWARVQNAKRPRGGGSTGPKSSDLNTARTMLDDQVKREADALFAKRWLPRSRSLLARARSSDELVRLPALTELGVSDDLYKAATSDGVDAPKARVVFEQALNIAMKDWATRVKAKVDAATAAKYAGRYANLRSIADRAAGMEDEPVYPFAEFENQINSVLSEFE